MQVKCEDSVEALELVRDLVLQPYCSAPSKERATPEFNRAIRAVFRGSVRVVNPMVAPLFSPGQLAATPGALALLADVHTNPAELLAHHQVGDRGEVSHEDARENELSVLGGLRILSSYQVGEGGEKVWIITEAERSSICILLPAEY